MTDTFNFPANAQTAGSIRLVSTAVKFADGYEQETPELDPARGSWNVVCNGYRPAMKAVQDWCIAHAGQAFFWTPPLGEQGYYKVREISNITPEGGNYFVLTLLFEQVREP